MNDIELKLKGARAPRPLVRVRARVREPCAAPATAYVRRYALTWGAAYRLRRAIVALTRAAIVGE
eukprot:9153963-Pyramimonas_sp.AAC.1